MPKTKPRVNKSKLVRELIAKHPDMGPSEMADEANRALKPYRQTISPGFVSNIKTKLKGRQGAKKKASGGSPGRLVANAAALINWCGSAEAAKEAIDEAVEVAALVNGK